MPIVRIELFPGRTAEQKAACAEDVIAAVVKHLKAPAAGTQVIFVDVERADWITGKEAAPPATG